MERIIGSALEPPFDGEQLVILGLAVELWDAML
jgi:hypothetical protein